MIVPNSHYTRALRKLEKWSEEESLAEKWSASKVAGLILEGAITISNPVKVELSCTYTGLLRY